VKEKEKGLFSFANEPPKDSKYFITKEWKLNNSYT